jgi:hypothetical protein
VSRGAAAAAISVTAWVGMPAAPRRSVSNLQPAAASWSRTAHSPSGSLVTGIRPASVPTSSYLQKQGPEHPVPRTHAHAHKHTRTHAHSHAHTPHMTRHYQTLAQRHAPRARASTRRSSSRTPTAQYNPVCIRLCTHAVPCTRGARARARNPTLYPQVLDKLTSTGRQ